jgi:DNA-binding NarL/FixJ family response regulator
VDPTREEPALDGRDLAILRLLGEGRQIDAIARQVGISERTVRRSLRRLCDSIEVATPIEAVVWAVRRDLL